MDQVKLRQRVQNQIKFDQKGGVAKMSYNETQFLEECKHYIESMGKTKENMKEPNAQRITMILNTELEYDFLQAIFKKIEERREEAKKKLFTKFGLQSQETENQNQS